MSGDHDGDQAPPHGADDAVPVSDADGVGQASNGEIQLSPTHGSGMAGRAGGAADHARPDRASAQAEVAERFDVGRGGGPSATAEQAAAADARDDEPDPSTASVEQSDR
jgi:hypothetical protein